MKHFLLITSISLVALTTFSNGSPTVPIVNPSNSNDTNRIVFGNDIQRNQYVAYQVSLQYRLKNGDQKHFCGGSVISPTHVLTAAHCCDGLNQRRMSILAGIRTLHDTQGSRRQVIKCSMHERYRQTEFNDIAVLTIDPPLNFSESIKAIAVNNTNIIGGNVPVTLTGWGLRLPVELPFIPENYHAFNFPITLQIMNYFTLSNIECQSQGMTDVSPKEICALRRTVLPQGACIGDSGGPLVTKTNAGLQQVGIVSYGFRVCGVLPDVYTRVSMYTDWLKAKMA